jgi:hypothetical protein
MVKCVCQGVAIVLTMLSRAHVDMCPRLFFSKLEAQGQKLGFNGEGAILAFNLPAKARLACRSLTASRQAGHLEFVGATKKFGGEV